MSKSKKEKQMLLAALRDVLDDTIKEQLGERYGFTIILWEKHEDEQTLFTHNLRNEDFVRYLNDLAVGINNGYANYGIHGTSNQDPRKN